LFQLCQEVLQNFYYFS